MSRGGRSTGLLSRVSIALAGLALFVRLLIPAGYLLSEQSASSGLPNLVICTGHGELVVAVDADGKPVPAKHDGGKSKGGDHPCTYSSASAAQVAPLLLATVEPIRLASTQSSPLLTTQRPGLGLAAPPPYTTGPPSII